MELIKDAVEWVLHFDKHLGEFISLHGAWWAYLLLFVIVFCETGLVVTPFLPGDSLLFAAGALAGRDLLEAPIVIASLLAAAIIGDTVNYHVGQYLGPRLFKEDRRSGVLRRFLKREHLERTERFFERYGGKTIVIARFVPIVRTFAPFVAGMGSMRYRRFLAFNVSGAVVWVVLLVVMGIWVGQRPEVEENFSLVVLGIIFLSLLPPVVEYVKARRERRRVPVGS